MENQELIEYIKSSLSRGKTREDIYKELLNAGWSIDDIQDVFEDIANESKGERTRRRSVSIILIIGVILVGAGIFSFIAANWQAIPRLMKILMIVLTIIVSYWGGWFFMETKRAERFQKMGEALLLLGSIVYGAGIFLVAQMFNIKVAWPEGFILWMIGVIIMGLSVDSFLQFYLAIIIGMAAIIDCPFDILTSYTIYDLTLFTPGILILVAAIITFISGYLIRSRIPSEFKKF